MGIVENPVIRGCAPDPCACRGHDGAWYIAVSTFEWYPGVHIYRSTNLATWDLVAAPLDRLSLLNLRGEQASAGVWAPALSWADGKYWLLYTDTKSWHGEPKIGTPLRDQYNYLTTAERVDGEWSEPVFLTGGGYDPSLFHDDDGRKYFVYIRRDYRFPAERLFEGIMLQEYSVSEQKLIGGARAIYHGAHIPIDYFIKQQIYEGPHIYKRNGYYYLITAEGGVGSTHATCISRSKDIWGPYEMHPERRPFLTAFGSRGRLKRAGHGNIFTGPDGRDYITFLCARPMSSPEDAGKELSPLGRETGIAPLEWRDDWPYLAGASADGKTPPECFELPGTTELRHSTVERYEFGQLQGLPLEFQSLRVPIDESWCSLSKDRPLFLRLYGRDSPASRFDQSLLARRVRHLSFTVETELEFYPRCHLQFAGLMLRYDENSFYYLIVTRDDETGATVLSYMETLAGVFSYTHRIQKLQDKAVKLRVESSSGKLRFSASQNEEVFIDCGIEKDLRLLSDETAYPIGFTGAFVGIAASDMLGERTPADFSYFEYRGLE